MIRPFGYSANLRIRAKRGKPLASQPGQAIRLLTGLRGVLDALAWENGMTQSPMSSHVVFAADRSQLSLQSRRRYKETKLALDAAVCIRRF